MPDYIVQKAVSPDKVVKKNRKTLAEYGQTYLAQAKYDGCCAVLRLDTGDGLSRTGERYPSLDPIIRDMREQLGHDLVVIGEAWWPGKDQFNLISGEFRRLEPSANLSVIANDCLTPAEFDAGHSDVPYSARLDRLPISSGMRWGKIAGWQPGTYGDPQALANDWVARGGYDGIILRDPAGTWPRGSGTTGEIIKVKRVLSFDLEITGCFAGKGKHAGRMGGIYVDFRGKRLAVGTGFTDEQRSTWLDDGTGDRVLSGYTAGRRKIVEIEAMDFSSDGLLREPRFKSIRFDKLEPDAL